MKNVKRICTRGVCFSNGRAITAIHERSATAVLPLKKAIEAVKIACGWLKVL
jgi:hypothetical protein